MQEEKTTQHFQKENDNSRPSQFNDSKNSDGIIFNKKALIGTLFGVGGLVAFVSAKDEIFGRNSEIEDNAEMNANINNPIDEPVEDRNELLTVSKSDNFSNAFAEQRTLQGSGGIFQYDGKYYNTFYKEEYEKMSKDEVEKYYESVTSKIKPIDAERLIKSNEEVISENNTEIIEPVKLTETDGEGNYETKVAPSIDDSVSESSNDEKIEEEDTLSQKPGLDLDSQNQILNDNDISPNGKYLLSSDTQENQGEKLNTLDVNMEAGIPSKDVTSVPEIIVVDEMNNNASNETPTSVLVDENYNPGTVTTNELLEIDELHTGTNTSDALIPQIEIIEDPNMPQIEIIGDNSEHDMLNDSETSHHSSTAELPIHDETYNHETDQTSSSNHTEIHE